MDTKAQPHANLAHRMGHELQKYAIIVLYLYICFAAILFYRMAVERAQGIDYALHGLALIKALIIGKFMLIGQAARIGGRHGQGPLVYLFFYRSFAFLVLLLGLLVIEEAIVGVIHGRTVTEALSDIGGGNWLQISATCLLLWLILLPYLAFQLIGEALGEGALRRMFFGTN